MNSDTEDYITTIFGEVRPEYKMMEKYVPGLLDGNIRTRRAIYPHPTKDKDTAIPRKYKELMIIALEVGTQHGGGQGEGSLPGVDHSRSAVRNGATPKEIAETIAIAMYMCGQPAIVDYGYHCIVAAEDEYRKMSKG